MKPFSPFQTTLHLECPIKRRLVAKERWVPRVIEQRDISAILGTAIGAGLEVYNRGGDAPNGVAYNKATELCRDALQHGRTVPERHQSQWDRLSERAEAALFNYGKLADENDRLPPGLPPGTRIVSVERSFGPEGGWARPDLEVDDGLHDCVPYDYKSSISYGQKKSDWPAIREKRIQRFAESHQLMHYCAFRQTLHYYIGNMILEPFQFETLRFDVHPETLRMWQRGAVQTWDDMAREDRGERVPAMASSHADQFGECPFKRACFDYHLDPALMAGDYVRVPWKS